MKFTSMLPYVWQVTGANLDSYLSIKGGLFFCIICVLISNVLTNERLINTRWPSYTRQVLHLIGCIWHNHLGFATTTCNISTRCFTCTTVAITFVWFGGKKMFGSGLTSHSVSVIVSILQMALLSYWMKMLLVLLSLISIILPKPPLCPTQNSVRAVLCRGEKPSISSM